MRPDYCPVAQEPCQAMCAMSDVRCKIRDSRPQPADEPVAWMHRHIDNNVITHKPADLNRHSDRWTPLYTTPQPCPTCQSLARTVMLDQTGYDPRPWVGLTDEDRQELAAEQHSWERLCSAVETKLREKNR